MPVFDELIVQSAPGVTLASLARPVGPIERGAFDEFGDWVPALAPTPVNAAGGFGIAGDGRPYFDVAGAAEGEEADLWVDPSTMQVWLEAA